MNEPTTITERIPDDLVTRAYEAAENDVHCEHAVCWARAVIEAAYRDLVGAALRNMADQVDRGPTFPLPPSVISALIRERADDLGRATAEATDD